MKRVWLLSLAAGILLMGSTAAPALAATSSTKPPVHTPFYSTEIDLSGKRLSAPQTFAYQDTAYMPIWYVQQGLEKLGFQPSWDGHNWKLTTPSTIKPDLTNVNPGKSNMKIYLNGTLVQTVDGIYDKDPSSGVMTTYMPIWYVMQALKRVNVDSTWDGKKWGMTPKPQPPVTPPVYPPVPDNEVGKGTFIQALLTTLGIQPDTSGTSPYDDITETDGNWGYVHAAIEDNILPADSDTHFGMNDVVTMGMVDQMYWNAKGISHADYEPGGAPYPWGAAIGLNVNGLSESTPIAPSDVATIQTNLENIARGYTQDSGGLYHLLYPAGDDYTSGLDSSSASYAMSQMYTFFNQTTVSDQSGSLVVTLPSTLNTQWFVYGTTTNSIQYSLDNGASWVTADVFDTRDLANSYAAGGHILVKAASSDGLSVSYNELVPSLRGTVALGEIVLSDVGNGFTVQRGF